MSAVKLLSQNSFQILEKSIFLATHKNFTLRLEKPQIVLQFLRRNFLWLKFWHNFCNRKEEIPRTLLMSFIWKNLMKKTGLFELFLLCQDLEFSWFPEKIPKQLKTVSAETKTRKIESFFSRKIDKLMEFSKILILLGFGFGFCFYTYLNFFSLRNQWTANSIMKNNHKTYAKLQDPIKIFSIHRNIEEDFQAGRENLFFFSIYASFAAFALLFLSFELSISRFS